MSRSTTLPRDARTAAERLPASDEMRLLPRDPAATMFRSPQGGVTAATVLSAALKLAGRLPEQPSAIILCTDRVHFTIGLLAVVVRGGHALLPPGRHGMVLEAIARSRSGCIVLWDDEAPAIAPGTTAFRVESPAAGDGHVAVPAVPRDQLAVLAFTSGSTGEPKPNEKPWCTLREGTLINGPWLFGAEDGGQSVVATVPPQHMYGLETSVLAPMFLDVAVYAGRPFFPADVARALGAMPAPRTLVTTPVHLRAMLAARIGLPAVERIVSATAPLDPALARAAERATGGRTIEVYGCTETGCLAARSPAEDSAWLPFPEFRLEERQSGIEVSAPHLPASVMLSDRLELLPDGRFRLLGRTSDLVNVAGKRASLADLSLRLLAIDGVQDAVLFVPGERGEEVGRLAGMIVASRPADAILREFATLVDPVFAPRPLIAVSSLPRSETGKLDRAALDRLWAARGFR